MNELNRELFLDIKNQEMELYKFNLGVLGFLTGCAVLMNQILNMFVEIPESLFLIETVVLFYAFDYTVFESRDYGIFMKFSLENIMIGMNLISFFAFVLTPVIPQYKQNTYSIESLIRLGGVYVTFFIILLRRKKEMKRNDSLLEKKRIFITKGTPVFCVILLGVVKLIKKTYFRCLLWMKRQKRRLQVILQDDLKIYIAMTVSWALFALLKCLIGEQKISINVFGKEIYSDLNDIFSTVILVFIIRACERIKTHKKRLEVQYYKYIEALDTYSNFLYDIYNDEIFLHYYPFYNDMTFNVTIEYIKSHEIKDAEKNQRIQEWIDNSKELVDDIRLKYKNREMILSGDSFGETLSCVDEAMQNYSNVRSMENLCALLKELYRLVDSLRRIWRYDADLNRSINGEKQDSYVDFYKRMELKDFSLKRLRSYIDEKNMY